MIIKCVRYSLIMAATSSSFNWGTFWRNQLRQWHWISSAISLMGLVLFSVTGFTLNHATAIEAKPHVVTIEKELPEATLKLLAPVEANATLTAGQAKAIRAATGVDVRGATVD